VYCSARCECWFFLGFVHFHRFWVVLCNFLIPVHVLQFVLWHLLSFLVWCGSIPAFQRSMLFPSMMWRWRQYGLPYCYYITISVHSVISQKKMTLLKVCLDSFVWSSFSVLKIFEEQTWSIILFWKPKLSYSEFSQVPG